MGRKLSTIDLIRRFTNGKFDKNLSCPLERRFLPFQLPIDKTIVIEGTFREMLITLATMKISLCTIDMAEVRHHLK